MLHCTRLQQQQPALFFNCCLGIPVPPSPSAFSVLPSLIHLKTLSSIQCMHTPTTAPKFIGPDGAGTHSRWWCKKKSRHSGTSLESAPPPPHGLEKYVKSSCPKTVPKQSCSLCKKWWERHLQVAAPLSGSAKWPEDVVLVIPREVWWGGRQSDPLCTFVCP